MTDRQSFDLSAAYDENEEGLEEFDPAERRSLPQASEPAAANPDPLPFAAPSQRRSSITFETDEPGMIEDSAAALPHEDPVGGQSAPHFTVVEPGDPEDADDRPLEELGLVQLAARLGASIERRRARLTAGPSTVPSLRLPVTPAADADFEAAEPEDAARAIADFFGPAPAEHALPEAGCEMLEVVPEEPEIEPASPGIPAAMRDLPVDQDEDEDEEGLTASFSLPLAKKPAAAVAPVPETQQTFDEEDEDDLDGEYSSLLEMKNPFVRQQEFVRVDEPEDDGGVIEPTVTFPSPAPAFAAAPADSGTPRPFDPPENPGESVPRAAASATPRDPGDAERNLRDALATLQRMSGAA